MIPKPSPIKFAAAALVIVALVRATPAQVTFPREIAAPEGTVVIYQPQPERLVGNQLTCRAAMSLLPKGEKEPTFGVFWFTADIFSDEEEGMAAVRGIRVTKVHWPDSMPAAEATFTKIVGEAAAKADLTISRVRLAASLANAEREQQSLAELKNDPPKIIFANKLSVLLFYDGSPRWSKVEGNPYERALNTPFLVVRDGRSRKCFLGNGKLWYSASDPLGPWESIPDPPADLAQMLPEPESDDPVPSVPPDIIVATEPTELVVSDGDPKWKPVGDGSLLYVENTETPWVRELATQQLYLLLSGRWFRSAGTAGPWAFVRPDQLPDGFKNIPAASDLGGVRVSVAGTEEAEDAVLDAAIPTTAAIQRSEAKIEIVYDGEPQFEKIPGTQVSQAVNTASQVLRIGSKYYACDNGVWFVAAGAKGPWAVADKVPEEEIQKIPPSSSAYNVTYVHVYHSTPEVVYVGYTPGYLWAFPYYGVPVYGTGWYYPPHVVFYYPRPYTYGFHVGYNPWTGWNFGASWNVAFLHYGGWGGVWIRPGWGGCCHGWYGGYAPGWGGGYHGGHNTINIGSVNIGNNINFGNQARVSERIRGNPNAGHLRRQTVYDQPANRARQAERIAQPSDIRPAPKGDTNVLADRSGKVVRKQGNTWQTREGDKWRDTNQVSRSPAPTSRIDRDSLERDWKARERGGRREKRQNQVPRRPGSGRRPRSQD